MTESLDLEAKFALMSRSLHVDVSNFFLIQYRAVDGLIVTGKNSGTHWLRCMLSHALAAQHDLPPPERTSGRASEDFIGHPRWPKKHAALPHLGSSHTLPAALSGVPLVRRLFKMPPVVVLVRAIPDAMLSHYVKWGDMKGLSLSDYVRLPAPGRKDIADVWWYMDFFNRWGAIAKANPRDVMVARYEDLRADPGAMVARIAKHLGIELDAHAIAAAVEASRFDYVRERLDPSFVEQIVPDRARRESIAFSDIDSAYLSTLMAERLRFDFGYGAAAPACATEVSITLAPTQTVRPELVRAA